MNHQFIINLIILSFLITSSLLYSEEQFKEEIIVEELLLNKEEGVDRIDEPVIFGIPIPESLELKEKDGNVPLRILGVDKAQFRTLSKWYSGNIKWVKVAFPKSIKANKKEDGIFLTKGLGNFGGEKIAKEFDKKIVIDTGKLRVTILKEKFNILDNVIIDGEEIVKSGTSQGIVLIDENGKEYSSTFGEVTNIKIEDNGPVFCVIRIDGNLKDKEGNWLTDYTIRLRGYSGKTYITMQYVLRNANSGNDETICPQNTNYCKHLKIKGIEHIIKLSLKGKTQAFFSTHTQPYTFPLEENIDAYIYQSVTDKKISYINGRFASPIPYKEGKDNDLSLFKEKGYKIGYGDKILFDFSINDTTTLPNWKNPKIAWINLEDENGKGCLVAIQKSRWLWPVGLSGKKDGTLKIGTHPPLNKWGYIITWRTHETKEILLYFHKEKLKNPEEIAKAFEYPLIGRVKNFEYYDRCKIINNRLISPEKQINFMYKHGYNKKEVESLLYKEMEEVVVTRHKSPNEGGYNNNHDTDWDNIIRFWRFGHTTSLFSALSETMYRIDFSNSHHEDGLILNMRDSDPSLAPYYILYKLKGEVKNKEENHSKQIFTNDHHPMIARMYLSYLATGEERFKDGFIEQADYIFKVYAPRIRAHIKSYGRNDSRLIARCGIEMLILAWDLLKFSDLYEKDTLYDFLKGMIYDFLHAEISPINGKPFKPGWDSKVPGEASKREGKFRGFFSAPKDGNNNVTTPVINSLYYSYIIPKVLSMIYHYIPDESIKKDALLRMKDMAFFSEEYFRFLDFKDKNLRRPILEYKLFIPISKTEFIPTYPLSSNFSDPNLPIDPLDSTHILSCCLFDQIQQYTSNSILSTGDKIYMKRFLSGLERAWYNKEEYKIWQHQPEFMDVIFLDGSF